MCNDMGTSIPSGQIDPQHNWKSTLLLRILLLEQQQKETIEYVMRMVDIHVCINDAKRGRGEKREKVYQQSNIANRNAHEKKKKKVAFALFAFAASTKAINVIMIVIMIVISCFRYKLQTGHKTQHLVHRFAYTASLFFLLSTI